MELKSRKVFVPRLKVFVDGLDVTGWVKSVNIEWGIDGSPGKCRITLASPDSLFVLTEKDIENLRHKGKTGNNIKDSVIERRIIYEKIAHNKSKEEVLGKEFFVMSAIFVVGSVVRVFFGDYMEKDKWYYGFAGVVVGYTYSVDVGSKYKENLTLNCLSSLYWLQVAMVSSSIGILIPEEVREYIDERTSAVVDFSAFKNYFDMYGFYGGIEAMFLGLGVGDEKKYKVRHYVVVEDRGEFVYTSALDRTAAGCWKGVNWFTVEGSRISMWKVDEISLKNWDFLLDFRVRYEDIYRFAMVDSATLTNYIQSRGIVFKSVEDIVNFIGTRPSMYPDSCGWVNVLLPPVSDEILAAVVQSSFAGGNAQLMYQWKSRLMILREWLDRLGMCIYSLPSGEVVIEYLHISLDEWEKFEKENYELGGLRKSVVNFSKDYGKVVTMMIVQPSVVRTKFEVPGNVNLPRQVVVLNKDLIGVVGIKALETSSFRGLILSRMEADAVGHFLMNQMNLRVDGFDYGMVFNPAVRVNRMYKVDIYGGGEVRFSCFGLSFNVRQNVVWRSSADTALSLGNIIGKNGLGEYLNLNILDVYKALGV